MSVALLKQDKNKDWLDIRCNDVQCDGELRTDAIASTAGGTIVIADVAQFDDTVQCTDLKLTDTTNQIVFSSDSTFKTTLTAPVPLANRTVTIPDALANSSFVMTEGGQTINGSKQLSSALAITPATNQLVLGTTFTTTVNSVAPVASRVYTIPDAGGAASFMLTAGNQSASGTLALTNATDATSSAAAAVMATGGVGIAKKLFVSSSGIWLENATGSYVPTALDYWEEVVAFAPTFSGAWAAPAAISMLLSRRGKQVTITFPNSTAVANAAALLSSGTALPARFRPTQTKSFPILGQDNGVDVALICRVQTGGTIDFGTSPTLGNFTNANAAGPYGCSVVFDIGV